MGPLDLLIHLLNFLAPALGLGLGVAFAGRWVVKNKAQTPGFIMQAAINFAVGVLVLLAGLWFFGRDGKMATYAALVTMVALSQWVTGRQWR